MLPFSSQVLQSNFAAYAAAIWPGPVIGWVLALIVLVLALRAGALSGRIIAALLAAAWLLIGGVYHLTYFATISFFAPLFAALFILEGLLIAWRGVVRGDLKFAFGRDVAGLTGLALALMGLVLYPLLAWAGGQEIAQLPLAGTAPTPTVIFTLGMLLAARPRAPVYVLVIPLLCTLTAIATVWVLGMREDALLLIAGVAALGVMIVQRARG